MHGTVCFCTSCEERNPIAVDPRFSIPEPPRACSVTQRARMRYACRGVEIYSYLIKLMGRKKGRGINGSGEGEVRDGIRCRGGDVSRVGGGVVGEGAASGENSEAEPGRDIGYG